MDLPNDPILLGGRFFQQALVPDSLAGNPLGLVLSDAAEALIGD